MSGTSRVQRFGAVEGASSRSRLLVAVVVGVLAAGATLAAGAVSAAALVGWDAVAVMFTASVWLTVRRYDAPTTARHALRDNPSRPAADTVVLVAAVASLLAVAVVLVDAGNATGGAKVADLALGVTSVVVSWTLVHTIFALNYARLYYQEPVGGVDFNSQDQPAYLDFAYLAFTIGMTFQVSDTQISRTDIRRAALRHALIAYLFGSVIIAVTINLVAGLSK